MIKFLLLFSLIFSSNAMSAPITPYEVERNLTDNIQIREYKELLLAKVIVDKNDSENKPFSKLFKFISGENDQNQEIKMTAPVFKESQNSKMSMSFAMPTDFNKENLPKPNDENIKVENIESQRFIVITFSGRSSDDNFEEYQKILAKKIKKENIKADLISPIRAYYNHPWMLPLLKRNEVLFKLN